jgi:putative NADH-flavin reductase
MFMRIAVYGASGMIGSRVVAEAVRRGHQVTGLTRSDSDVPGGVRSQRADAGEPATAKEIAQGNDVVVSAIGPSRTGGDHQEFLGALRNLVETAGDARLVVVGGAGSLLVDGRRLVDGPDFNPLYKAEALTQSAALDYFRSLGASVDWTYVSPPPVVQPGERTGRYRLGADSPAGSSISAEDFAAALLDEIENPQHPHRRFTAAS